MTSTPFNVGLTNENKLTSRVLKPPGGGHTDIFGIHQQEPEPLRTGRRAAPQKTADQIQLAPHESPKKDSKQPELEEVKATNGNGNHAAGETMPDSYSETYEEAKQEFVEEKREQIQLEPAKAEPAKRVRVPPGGFSSQLW